LIVLEEPSVAETTVDPVPAEGSEPDAPVESRAPFVAVATIFPVSRLLTKPSFRSKSINHEPPFSTTELESRLLVAVAEVVFVLQ
jgi:hypothetical protein